MSDKPESKDKRKPGRRVLLALAAAALLAGSLALLASAISSDNELSDEVVTFVPDENNVLAEDTGRRPDPTRFWGRVDCVEHPSPLVSGHTLVPSGGDTHDKANGEPQGNTSFRRMTVYDGDDIDGERCELGFNDQRGPTAFYREGTHRLTFISLRLPGSSPVAAEQWRVVAQMKQAQPYHNPDPASIFELQARGGRWQLGSDWHKVWSTPASQDVWTRFVFDVVYSADPAVGSIRVAVDLNGDGDYTDDVDGDGRVDERSPRVHRATLRTETEGDPRYLQDPGESIPSHLRAGIYQDAAHPCPATGAGCAVDVDNVQVVKLPPPGR